jgi:hypothetical protein
MISTKNTQFLESFKKELDTGEKFGYTRRVCNDFLSPRVTNKAVFVHNYQKYKQNEQMSRKTSQEKDFIQLNESSGLDISLAFQRKM